MQIEVSFNVLKETQTIKVYWAKSYKYFIIIAGSNTEILKTHVLLNEILFSLCLSLCLLQRVLSVALLNGKILNITSDHSCRIYFRFLVENGFLQVKPARCHYLHKKTVFTRTSTYNISSLQLLQSVYANLSLL